MGVGLTTYSGGEDKSLCGMHKFVPDNRSREWVGVWGLTLRAVKRLKGFKAGGVEVGVLWVCLL